MKWMALESINYRTFSSESDVWSYGIVLWELFSLGKTPYAGIQPDESFTRLLENGHRMEKPVYSTDDLYKVMRDCWLSEPGLRPTFNELVEKMSEELQEGEKQHYLDLNAPLELENAERERKYVSLLQSYHKGKALHQILKWHKKGLWPTSFCKLFFLQESFETPTMNKVSLWVYYLFNVAKSQKVFWTKKIVNSFFEPDFYTKNKPRKH